MRSCKGTVEGRARRTPAQALRWSNHLTAAVAASKLWLKSKYLELRQADPDGQPQLSAWLFHLSHAPDGARCATLKRACFDCALGSATAACN